MQCKQLSKHTVPDLPWLQIKLSITSDGKKSTMKPTVHNSKQFPGVCVTQRAFIYLRINWPFAVFMLSLPSSSNFYRILNLEEAIVRINATTSFSRVPIRANRSPLPSDRTIRHGNARAPTAPWKTFLAKNWCDLLIPSIFNRAQSHQK